MGLLLGLVLGIGLFLVVTSRADRPRMRRARGLGDAVRQQLVDAGLGGVSVAQLGVVSGAAALAAFLGVYALSAALPMALAFGVFAALGPRAFVRRRAHARATARAEAWPEAVDNLVSAVRAGLSLPEAVSALGVSGPPELQPAFTRFARRQQASGSFSACLDHLAADLADPVGDRVIEALRIAREVGGSDLGIVLRTLSRFLREDARTRGEIAARQSWTVNAARVALAAPWVVLLLLASQSSTIHAYNSAAGALVLSIGGCVSYVAYRLMKRIGQLPAERRIAT